MDNYLASEQAIIDRINARVPGFRHVGPFVDLLDFDETGHPTPACFVRHVRDELTDLQGKVQYIAQLWDIIIATHDARDSRNMQDSRLAAGALLRDVNERAMTNFQPAEGFSLIERVNNPNETYYAAGGYCAHFLRYATHYEVKLDFAEEP